MKDAYYFSHDANARHDPKLSGLTLKYGMAGYGAWWIIVEMLREQEDYRLPVKPYIWACIARETLMTPGQAEEFITDCIEEFDLLEMDEDSFYSPSLLRRMEIKEEKRQKRVSAANKRWSAKDDTPDAMHMQSSASAMQNDAKESKGKESKTNYDDTFERVWSLYPRKINKAGAYKAYKARIKEGTTKEHLELCTENYGKEVEGKEERYILHGSTFFGPDKRFLDYAVARASPGGVSYCSDCGSTLIDGRCLSCEAAV